VDAARSLAFCRAFAAKYHASSTNPAIRNLTAMNVRGPISDMAPLTKTKVVPHERVTSSSSRSAVSCDMDSLCSAAGYILARRFAASLTLSVGTESEALT